MADECGIVVGDGVYGQVVTTMANMWARATQAFQIAVESMTTLGNFIPPAYNFNTAFTPSSKWAEYVRPVAPATPTDTHLDKVTLPLPPAILSPTLAFDTAPADNTQAPNIVFGKAPSSSVPVNTAIAPLLEALTIPVSPTFVFPQTPTLYALNLPLPPTITIPTFNGVRPNLNLQAPPNTFGFTPEMYASALLDQTRNQISFMLLGGTGLPLAVVQALRARAYAAVDIEELRAVDQTIEEYGSRGFAEPSGILNQRIQTVRQNNQNNRASLSRDIYIKDQEIAVDNMKFAVTSGISLESKLMDIFVEIQRLMLDAAKATMQFSIDVFNAQVGLANLEIQLYTADAQVYRDQIQAELAKVELYRAEIEAQKAIGELNLQLVQMYDTQVRAVATMVQVYTAQVQAVEVQSRIQLNQVEAYRAQISAFVAEIQAYTAEWDAYGKQIEANVSKEKIYEISVDAFATRIKAWSDTQNQKIEYGKLSIQQNELNITAYKAQLDAINSQIEADLKRVQSLIQMYDAQVRKYEADASVEKSASDAGDRGVEIYVDQESKRQNVAIETARINIQQLQAQTEQLLKAKETIAQISSQMAAAFASAGSVHAGINSSLSQGQSCSTSYQFSQLLDSST